MILKTANQLILQKIAESEGRITFGLLPLNETEEMECIQCALDYCGGKLDKLIHLMRPYDWECWFLEEGQEVVKPLAPALACYTIAACASQAVTVGKRFWDPFTERLGIAIDINKREGFSNLYLETCSNLGVLIPDVSSMAWKNIAPIMAQASILHAWAHGLARAFKTTIKQIPIPDLEDELSLHRFSKELGRHVHGQQNLTSILSTEIGEIVAHRIISSYAYNDYNTLPAHLREPMREAFMESGSGMTLKSPYIAYCDDLGELEIVLPKISPKLTTERTHWLIGNRQFSPQIEHHIHEGEFNQSSLSINLVHLKQFGDQNFELKLGMVMPFRIFNQQGMREKKFKDEPTITLPPAEYTVVMPLEASTNESDYEEVHGEYRILSDVFLRPGLSPLEITLMDRTYSLQSSLKMGIYNSSDLGNTVMIRANEENIKLHYGEVFGLEAYIPKDQHIGILSMAILDSSEHQLLQLTIDLQSEDEGVYDYSSNLEQALREASNNLTPGIHFLKITISTNSSSAIRKIWYWKGLQRISDISGFICDSLPKNIDFDKSKGIQKSSCGCMFPPDFHAPEIKIKLKDDNNTILSISRPGIIATCSDPSDGWIEDLKANTTISVNSEDKRVIKFHSGGFQKWQILCNEKNLVELNKNKLSYSIHLRSISAQYGNSGKIIAQSESGETIVLFNYASSLIASPLEFKPDHAQQTEVWTTFIPTEELGILGIECIDYTESPQGIRSTVVNLSNSYLYSETPDKYTTIPISEGVMVKIRLKQPDNIDPERLETWITIKPEQTKNQLLQINLLHMPSDTDQWLPLLCKEKYNPSQLSIISNYIPERAALALPWWVHLRSVNDKDLQPEDETYAFITNNEITQALHTLSELISTKYPTSVFKYTVKHLLSLPYKLAKRRQFCNKKDANQWWQEAVNELEKHAKSSNSPIVRTFLFSCNFPILAHRWIPTKKLVSTDPNNITPSLTLVADLHAKGGLLAYTQQNYHQGIHPKYLYESFQNFSDVLQGNADQLKDFQLNQFLSKIIEKAIEHSENYTSLDQSPVLSARHLLLAIKNLNKRSHVLATIASNDDPDHILNQPLQLLTRTHRELERLIPQINQSVHYESTVIVTHTTFNNEQAETLYYPNLPTLGNPQAKQLADLTWALCVIIRATAHEKMSPHDFNKYREIFEGVTSSQKSIDLILTFAPELFAYYTALLDFSLYDHTQN